MDAEFVIVVSLILFVLCVPILFKMLISFLFSFLDKITEPKFALALAKLPFYAALSAIKIVSIAAQKIAISMQRKVEINNMYYEGSQKMSNIEVIAALEHKRHEDFRKKAIQHKETKLLEKQD